MEFYHEISSLMHPDLAILARPAKLWESEFFFITKKKALTERQDALNRAPILALRSHTRYKLVLLEILGTLSCKGLHRWHDLL